MYTCFRAAPYRVETAIDGSGKPLFRLHFVVVDREEYLSNALRLDSYKHQLSTSRTNAHCVSRSYGLTSITS